MIFYLILFLDLARKIRFGALPSNYLTKIQFENLIWQIDGLKFYPLTM